MVEVVEFDLVEIYEFLLDMPCMYLRKREIEVVVTYKDVVVLVMVVVCNIVVAVEQKRRRRQLGLIGSSRLR